MVPDAVSTVFIPAGRQPFADATSSGKHEMDAPVSIRPSNLGHFSKEGRSSETSGTRNALKKTDGPFATVKSPCKLEMTQNSEIFDSRRNFLN